MSNLLHYFSAFYTSVNCAIKQYSNIMKIPLYVVDAFTAKAFTGNPAAVCLLEKPITDELMQNVASELRQTDTAFVTPTSDGGFKGATFSLRVFTPKQESVLCGHGTLATATVLFRELGNESPRVTFQGKSGSLLAWKSGDEIFLDFPQYEMTNVEEGNDFFHVAKEVVCGLPIECAQYCQHVRKMMVVLKNSCTKEDLTSISPDFGRLTEMIPLAKLKGVLVSLQARPGEDRDVNSRYFGPWVGIPEDPVSASSHGLIASYWANQLGKEELVAYQCSQRGGYMKLKVKDSTRVEIGGQATMLVKGEIEI